MWQKTFKRPKCKTNCQSREIRVSFLLFCSARVCRVVFSRTPWCVLGKQDLMVTQVPLCRQKTGTVTLWSLWGEDLTSPWQQIGADSKGDSDGDGAAVQIGAAGALLVHHLLGLCPQADLRPIQPFCVCRRLLVCGLNPETKLPVRHAGIIPQFQLYKWPLYLPMCGHLLEHFIVTNACVHCADIPDWVCSSSSTISPHVCLHLHANISTSLTSV